MRESSTQRTMDLDQDLDHQLDQKKKDDHKEKLEIKIKNIKFESFLDIG
jgi:hypothetical protein